MNQVAGEAIAAAITVAWLVFVVAVFVIVIRKAFSNPRRLAHNPGCSCGGVQSVAIIGSDGRDTGRTFSRPICAKRPQVWS